MTIRDIHTGASSIPFEGDLHPFTECLGSGAVVPRVTWSGGRIENLESLQVFMDGYANQWLMPRELPQIHQAAVLASGSKYREIIALDSPRGSEELEPALREASRRAGKKQLRMLMGLRDLKGLRRYEEAVSRGEAEGAHTVVYGIMLGVYSIPLVQGLTHYSQRTLLSLAETGVERLGMGAQAQGKWVADFSAKHAPGIRSAIDALLMDGRGKK